ncbi:hypothetical protein BC835DRAFT_1306668 [Cytidiella melzeri]|nr:hypothetical protein BC835DRAFT_1306668 [Cytidiella melzeri]
MDDCALVPGFRADRGVEARSPANLNRASPPHLRKRTRHELRKKRCQLPKHDVQSKLTRKRARTTRDEAASHTPTLVRTAQKAQQSAVEGLSESIPHGGRAGDSRVCQEPSPATPRLIIRIPPRHIRLAAMQKPPSPSSVTALQQDVQPQASHPKGNAAGSAVLSSSSQVQHPLGLSFTAQRRRPVPVAMLHIFLSSSVHLHRSFDWDRKPGPSSPPASRSMESPTATSGYVRNVTASASHLPSGTSRELPHPPPSTTTHSVSAKYPVPAARPSGHFSGWRRASHQTCAIRLLSDRRKRRTNLSAAVEEHWVA